MTYFRKFRLLLLLVLISLTGCGILSSVSNRQIVPVNALTGLPGENGRVLAVKFDDTTFAHPQQGVESADVVFVTQVEAGLTRLLAIYSSQYPEVIGPIRSARISDIDILAQIGRAHV